MLDFHKICGRYNIEITSLSKIKRSRNFIYSNIEGYDIPRNFIYDFEDNSLKWTTDLPDCIPKIFYVIFGLNRLNVWMNLKKG